MTTTSEAAVVTFSVRLPPNFAGALETAARKAFISRSDYARLAILQALTRDGVKLEPQS